MTNVARGEGDRPGWLQRVFGRELEEQLERATTEALAKDARLVELTRELERVAVDLSAKEARLAEVERELERLAAAGVALIAACTQRAESAEAQFKVEEGKSKRHEKIATAALQRADQRSAELDVERKKLTQLEGKCAQLVRRQEALAQESQARAQQLVECSRRCEAAERALEVTRSELELSQWALVAEQSSTAAREVEQSRVQTELGEQLATIAQLQRMQHALREELQERAKAAVRADGVRARQAAELEELSEQLVRIVRLSARALDAVLGPELHLGLEVGFAVMNPAVLTPADGERDAGALAARVKAQLVKLGLAEDFLLEARGESMSGHLRLPLELGAAEAASLARWVAAYATECVNEMTTGAQRLAVVSGGPVDFQLSTSPRGLCGVSAAVPPAYRARPPES